MSVVGIDPGLKGGVACILPRAVHAFPMPLVGSDINVSLLVRWLDSWNPIVAVIERQQSMPKQGVASTFKTGLNFGVLIGALKARQIPIELVTAPTWKRTVLAGTARDKKAAIEHCARRFPQIELIPERGRTPHDGIADALCIAEFGLIKHRGQ